MIHYIIIHHRNDLLFSDFESQSCCSHRDAMIFDAVTPDLYYNLLDNIKGQQVWYHKGKQNKVTSCLHMGSANTLLQTASMVSG